MFSSRCKMYASNVTLFHPYLKLLQESIEFGISLSKKTIHTLRIECGHFLLVSTWICFQF